MDLNGCSRLWLNVADDRATVLFRRTIEAAAGDRGEISLYADANYQLWCNGTYLGRGPAYHHPKRRPVERYDLTPHLVAGRNVIAVLVHCPGISLHNYVYCGEPGLTARIDVGGQVITTDGAWRATDRSGWSMDTPRRSWAIGFAEAFDAGAAPMGWQAADFDDAEWSPPQVHAIDDGEFIETGMPGLRHQFQPAVDVVRFAATVSDVLPLSRSMGTDAVGTHLMGEPWYPPEAAVLGGAAVAPVLEGLDGREAVVLLLDLGRQYTGAVTFDFTSESGGVIDVGWTEVLDRGRPALMRKGNSYVDRYIARAGDNQWLPHGYSAGRYIYLVLRGFEGAVRFERVGMLASEPDLDWSGAFECSDEKLNAIWQLCARTIRVGTQEGLVDCPTREQAVYVGDANPIADWVGRLTGDYGHWRYLVREMFAAQGQNGLIKTTVFSGQANVLLDYELLAVVQTQRYVQQTGDVETGQAMVPAARRLVDWFIERTEADGWLAIDWQALPRTRGHYVDWPEDPTADPGGPGMNIFIDHPGLGWHNREDPGIDRRGRNTALHALFVMALRALADLTGDDALRVRADALAEKIGDECFDQQREVFADGRYGDALLTQISQQTNTWAVMAKCCDRQRARSIMRQVLCEHDTDLVRSGPYFWLYMLPTLVELGLIKDALGQVRRLWGDVLNRGATTMWETFSGDELDSYCHPWACAPVEFLPRYVVGIGSLPQGADTIELRPQTALLDQAEATVMTPRGAVLMGWRDGKLYGQLPEGVSGALHKPDEEMKEVHEKWNT